MLVLVRASVSIKERFELIEKLGLLNSNIIINNKPLMLNATHFDGLLHTHAGTKLLTL